MSHFTVMVIGENPEDQLKPFDENLEVERYYEYTKAQLIQKGRKEIKKYKNSLYSEYLKDPIKYKNNCTDGHLKYVSVEFPKKLNWTDDEIYEDELKWYDKEHIGDEGEVYSERNPKSKWDWYELGGRWSGLIKLKKGCVGIIGEGGLYKNKPGIDQAKKGDISNFNEIITFALVKDGKWHERGKMGRWGVVINEKDRWEKELKKLTNNIPDNTLISIYDCHI